VKEELTQHVRWFRQSSPYINAHRDKVFVIAFGGEALTDGSFPHLVHDLALLSSLGVRLVLVPGARPQIEERLAESGAAMRYANGMRITDERALQCVKQAVGTVRVEIEALLSMGLANTPMAGSRIRVASGNFVTARPLGVRDGIDYQHTGKVRRVDGDAIRERLADGAVTLVLPLGYSPTGEVFNLYADDVACAVARELKADKLLFLQDGLPLTDAGGELIRELTVDQARSLLSERAGSLADGARRLLGSAVSACRSGVARVHLLDRSDGELLMELFTRDGVGTLITALSFERIREATIDDVGGIFELIEPLEQAGILVRRSRELLETEIDHFTVIEREGMVVACAGLYPDTATAVGEVSCFAVHPDYRGGQRGDRLLDWLERRAGAEGLERLFVLTTRTAHWFQERGFVPAQLADLPVSRQALYNYQRNSKVFIKQL